MEKISASLETIAETVEKNADVSKTDTAIKSARNLIKDQASPMLKELDKELATWQLKLSVILKETVGKKGMAKHARFWAEKLREARV